MKFSATLPFLRDRSSPEPYRETFEIAQIAEEAGFDTISLHQHHFQPGDPSQPLAVLAAIATRTRRIRLNTGVLILPMHDPLQIAEQVAVVDEISGGRALLCAGIGWNAFEYEALGVPFRERGARMEEALKVLKLLWQNENISFDGQFYRFPRLTMHPRPIQPGGPELWVAGDMDKAVERAARLGDAWMCGAAVELDHAGRMLRIYRDTCARENKPANWVLRRFGWMKPTRKEVEDGALQQYVNGLLTQWRSSSKEGATGDFIRRIDSGENVPATEIAHNRLIWGSPDDVIEQIRGLRDNLGVDHLHMGFGTGLHGSGDVTFGGLRELGEMLRLFGREVMPAFAGGDSDQHQGNAERVA